MLKKISKFFMAIINGIIGFIGGIFKAIFSVFKAIFDAFKYVFNAIISVIVSIYKGIAYAGKKFINSFKPVYKVTFTMYHVIPGLPVQENVSVHAFERGSSKEAIAFYNKVVHKTMENKIAPTVVALIKGKKEIDSKKFGPIDDIKKFRIAA